MTGCSYSSVTASRDTPEEAKKKKKKEKNRVEIAWLLYGCCWYGYATGPTDETARVSCLCDHNPVRERELPEL